MKIALFSNFLNMHQLPFCEYMYSATNGQFTFVATERIPEDRLKFGYSDLDRTHPFVLRTYDGEEAEKEALRLAEEADVVIQGSAPWFYLEERLKQNKLTFVNSERIYKTGYQHWKWPVRMWRIYQKYGRHKSLYLLCASAFASADFAKTCTFVNKAYKWGYFPPVKQYSDIDALIDQKKNNTIVWVARFIDWKHPEIALNLAQRLKKDGYVFRLNMIGNGELLEQMRNEVSVRNLSDCVTIPGAMKPEEVRRHMEEAEIHIFTSDRNEGWGAVLNESMNSACAVVASHAIGSVPFLLEDGANGLIYQDGNEDDLYQKVKMLLGDKVICHSLGKNAYRTLIGTWCADVAAKRLLNLADAIINGEKKPALFEEGPCSAAKILEDNWYRINA